MKLSPITAPYRAVQRSSSVLILAYIAATAGAARAVGGPAVVIALAALAVLATLAYELAYYRRFEYELTEDTLDIRSGVLGRRERELPYGRIQNVDVTRNAVQRLLGIAAVGFETAGGRRTEGSIRYVSAGEAERLQREVQRRKRTAGGPGAEDDGAPEAEEELFALSPRGLGLVGALSFDARVVGAVTLLGPGSVPFLPGMGADPLAAILGAGGAFVIGLLAVGLLLAAWALGIAVAVINYYGFRLTRAGDELRYERGLFRRYSGSIPLEKVQSVTIRDNPPKRAFGYATLTVETAGYAGSRGDARGAQVAVPIARRDRVRALAEEIEPFGDGPLARPPKRIRRRYVARYLLALGALTAAAYVADGYVPIALPWYGIGVLTLLVPPAAHLKWKHRGYRLGADHVATRNGFWSRSTTVVPYYRVQTVIDSRTVFQRRWGVATVVVDTAGSRSRFGGDAAAVDIGVGDALDLRRTLSARLQESLAERRTGIRPPRSSTAGG